MATVERFEDLRVWQVGRDIVNVIYQASWSGPFSKDYALPHGTSLIAQGRPREIQNRKRLHRAGGSAAEGQS